MEREFQTWKIVQVGMNFPEINQRLNWLRVSTQARNFLDCLHSTRMEEVEEDSVFLCRATVKELVGKDRATESEISKAIYRVGGEFCKTEVVPALRMQHKDQPFLEWLNIIVGEDHLLVIARSRDGVLWIRAPWASPSRIYPGNDLFVFRLRSPVGNGLAINH
jgi:hypothetical protein